MLTNLGTGRIKNTLRNRQLAPNAILRSDITVVSLNTSYLRKLKSWLFFQISEYEDENIYSKKSTLGIALQFLEVTILGKLTLNFHH